MLDYIFSILKYQSNLNRVMTTFNVVVVAYLVVQTKKIMNLEKEIKELTNQRGE